jgi:hypothetical protein
VILDLADVKPGRRVIGLQVGRHAQPFECGGKLVASIDVEAGEEMVQRPMTLASGGVSPAVKGLGQFQMELRRGLEFHRAESQG